ncbi:MAG: hypothetical protein IKZ43_01210 [Acidaminococcaceae bacterium]|nr:hypothetical protein [Acidaminococcaceae bacterium]
MVIEKDFFEVLRNGGYACLPKALYSLFILAVNNQDKEEMIVRRYARPTTIEDAVFLYKLQGLTIETEVNTKKFRSTFDRSYKITVNIPAFIANLSIFYQTTQEKLRNKYGVAEILGNRGKKSDNPRDKDILLFKRDIDDKEIWHP